MSEPTNVKRIDAGARRIYSWTMADEDGLIPDEWSDDFHGPNGTKKMWAWNMASIADSAFRDYDEVERAVGVTGKAQ